MRGRVSKEFLFWNIENGALYTSRDSRETEIGTNHKNQSTKSLGIFIIPMKQNSLAEKILSSIYLTKEINVIAKTLVADLGKYTCWMLHYEYCDFKWCDFCNVETHEQKMKRCSLAIASTAWNIFIFQYFMIWKLKLPITSQAKKIHCYEFFLEFFRTFSWVE